MIDWMHKPNERHRVVARSKVLWGQAASASNQRNTRYGHPGIDSQAESGTKAVICGLHKMLTFRLTQGDQERKSDNHKVRAQSPSVLCSQS